LINPIKHQGQIFSRVIGKRKIRSLGESFGVPSKDHQAWIKKMASKSEPKFPKGIYKYKSPEEANEQMESWIAQSMARKAGL
jgi:hypothetical protein